MTSLHVIVGSGPVGSATAVRLAGLGQRVRVVTRSGGGPAMAGVERLACDATDAERLVPLVAGAAVLYSCASPPYHRWATDWPPLAPTPTVRARPSWQLRAAGMIVPLVREIEEVRYQFDRPFVVDSSAYQTTFGDSPTPMDQALAATLAWWRQEGRSAA